MRIPTVTLALIALIGLAVAAVAAPLAPGRYGHMQMKLEATWFDIDVARLDMWFDEPRAARFRELAAGQRYSDERAEQIARVAMAAEDVYVQLVFLRDVSLARFLREVHASLARARDARYISQQDYASAWQRVRAGFARLSERGFEDGDRLLYRARAGSLRTTLIHGDRVLVDVTVPDAGARRAMLGSYFAPGSEFREPLIDSLFR